MKPIIYAFIFARKNSKRLKNKNILKLKKKTLVEHSINLAKNLKDISKVYVSTNSNKIIKIAKKNEVGYIKRPSFLCSDRSKELLSWKHAIRFLIKKKEKFNIFLSLPTTSPLRSKQDIIKLIKAYKINKSDITITVTKTNRQPNFNMVKVNRLGKVSLVMNNKKLFLKNNIFDMTTVGYISNPSYILKTDNIFSGKVKSIEIPRIRALDIDDSYDLKIGRLLLN
jgi:N-acylneuraminate cytidylyltransferase